MIKQGKNTTYCDNCKQTITLDIQKKYIGKGIVIQFLRCLHCGTKTLIDVTNKATREKQIELRKWSDARKKVLDIVIDGMSEEELKKIFMLADETKFNMDRLQGEIKVAKAELKKKYDMEL